MLIAKLKASNWSILSRSDFVLLSLFQDSMLSVLVRKPDWIDNDKGNARKHLRAICNFFSSSCLLPSRHHRPKENPLSLIEN